MNGTRTVTERKPYSRTGRRPASASTDSPIQLRPEAADQRFAAWLEQHRLTAPSKQGWDDVIGHAKPKRQLRSLAVAMAEAETLKAIGGRLPSAVLIHGEPGVGKTLLADVFCAELLAAALPVYQLTADELDARKLTRLGRWAAAQTQPTVLAIDGIELWGLDRRDDHHTAGTRAALFAALAALDRSAEAPVVWLLTNDRKSTLLDPALVRPGRLGSFEVILEIPGRADIERLLTALLERRQVAEQIPMDEAVALAVGISQAAIVGAVDEACIHSVADGSAGLRWEHLRSALQRRGGVMEPIPMSTTTRWLVAVHEAGHAIVGAALFGPDAADTMAIDETGFSGSTRWGWNDRDDTRQLDANEVLKRAALLLGGLSAEELILRAQTFGGGSDVDEATSLIKSFVRYGVAPEWGRLSWDSFTDLERGPALRDEMNTVVRGRVAEARTTADAIVSQHADAILRLARRLNDEGHLAGEALRQALREAIAETPTSDTPHVGWLTGLRRRFNTTLSQRARALRNAGLLGLALTVGWASTASANGSVIWGGGLTATPGEIFVSVTIAGCADGSDDIRIELVGPSGQVLYDGPHLLGDNDYYGSLSVAGGTYSLLLSQRCVSQLYGEERYGPTTALSIYVPPPAVATPQPTANPTSQPTLPTPRPAVGPTPPASQPAPIAPKPVVITPVATAYPAPAGSAPALTFHETPGYDGSELREGDVIVVESAKLATAALIEASSTPRPIQDVAKAVVGASATPAQDIPGHTPATQPAAAPGLPIWMLGLVALLVSLLLLLFFVRRTRGAEDA